MSAGSVAGRRAMLAHRDARAIALGTEGKLRVLADLLAQHAPERILIFTNDNATVYRISQDFLIPAITHQTPVKERHRILERFRQGDYKTLVTSHVLNEGVDVPEAQIAIILSGTGSTREYIQRLGRVLRQGSRPDKLAWLYEVVAAETSEEQTSQRRHRGDSPTPQTKSLAQPLQQQRSLQLVPPTYAPAEIPVYRVAEETGDWDNPAIDRSAQDTDPCPPVIQ
ncbi:helicase-related protein [Neosynechococcus sphagnicola]|uniref:helicase-related protein n=1 Tax=Neosynechococcus sphagnicola TaxID=1501145 RepID=UPI0030843DAB